MKSSKIYNIKVEFAFFFSFVCLLFFVVVFCLFVWLFLDGKECHRIKYHKIWEAFYKFYTEIQLQQGQTK